MQGVEHEEEYHEEDLQQQQQQQQAAELPKHIAPSCTQPVEVSQ